MSQKRECHGREWMREFLSSTMINPEATTPSNFLCRACRAKSRARWHGTSQNDHGHLSWTKRCFRLINLLSMTSTESTRVEYWTTAREPWPSLLFILPFLVVYEVGAIAHSHLPASRNGADLWIRHFGMETGFGIDWLFPLLAPMLLLIWQFAGRRPWSWSLETLSGMLAESLLFAMLLVLIGQATSLAFPDHVVQAMLTLERLPHLSTGNIPRIVSFLGAGIYEEMLFRLALLPVTFLSLRLIMVPPRLAMLGSVLISSWLFATAHYVGSPSLFSPAELSQAMSTVLDSPEMWFSYTFRFVAGLLFSVLFWVRGFGIAVGCHILYDLFVGVVLSGVG